MYCNFCLDDKNVLEKFLCGDCQRTIYCNKNCQKKDWVNHYDRCTNNDNNNLININNNILISNNFSKNINKEKKKTVLCFACVEIDQNITKFNNNLNNFFQFLFDDKKIKHEDAKKVTDHILEYRTIREDILVEKNQDKKIDDDNLIKNMEKWFNDLLTILYSFKYLVMKDQEDKDIYINIIYDKYKQKNEILDKIPKNMKEINDNIYEIIILFGNYNSEKYKAKNIKNNIVEDISFIMDKIYNSFILKGNITENKNSSNYNEQICYLILEAYLREYLYVINKIINLGEKIVINSVDLDIYLDIRKEIEKIKSSSVPHKDENFTEYLQKIYKIIYETERNADKYENYKIFYDFNNIIYQILIKDQLVDKNITDIFFYSCFRNFIPLKKTIYSKYKSNFENNSLKKKLKEKLDNFETFKEAIKNEKSSENADYILKLTIVNYNNIKNEVLNHINNILTSLAVSKTKTLYLLEKKVNYEQINNDIKEITDLIDKIEKDQLMTMKPHIFLKYKTKMSNLELFFEGEYNTILLRPQ